MFPTTDTVNNSNVLLPNNLPNTIPTEIATTRTTQSQLYPCNIDISNSPASLSNSHSNLKTIGSINPPNLVLLHHMYQTHYTLESYCQPISESFENPQTVCKFNRDCLVAKNKTLNKAPRLTQKSHTVFGSAIGNTKKNNYTLVDTRLVSCFNPQCKNAKTKHPKLFHHVCNMHMMHP